MIGPLLPPVLFLFVIGAILMWYGSRSAKSNIRKARWVKFVTYLVLVWSVIGLCALNNRQPLFVAMCLLVAIGTFELIRALRRTGWSVRVTALLVHGLCSWGLLRFVHLWIAPAPQVLFCLVFVVTCTFDAFSQVTGQIWGSRRLAPRLSPGKTVAGAVGGLIFATGFSLYLMEGQVWNGIQLGVPVSLAAFGGDLFYSWVKRRCGIKDFGKILPGHGGVLDRFDSLMGSATLTALWFTLKT